MEYPDAAAFFSHNNTPDFFSFFSPNLSALNGIEVDCGLSSMDERGYTHFVTLGCVLGGMAVVGILANILSIIVFSRMPQKSSTTFLIQMLAVADSLFLFTNLMMMSLIGWYNALGQICAFTEHFSYLMPYAKGLMEIARDLAVWMVAVVSSERYIAIYWPLQMSRICRTSVAAKVVWCLLLYVIVFNIPSFLQIKTGTVENGGVESQSFAASSLASSFVYNLTYYTVDSIINLVIPMVMVLTMNFRIILVLRRSRTQRAVISRSANTDRGSYATLMLVFIAIIFVVCSTPKLVDSLYIIWQAYSNPRIAEHVDDTSFALFITSALSQGLNSFCNFFIYCVTARRFRLILREMFSCWKCRERLYMCRSRMYSDDDDDDF